jgi:hypothetical protein
MAYLGDQGLEPFAAGRRERLRYGALVRVPEAAQPELVLSERRGQVQDAPLR